MESFDIHGVLQYLPHRYPFLLVDRVISYEPGKSLVGLKNVTFNEPFFQGHFPQHPIMPGVLILEALAQAAGILAFRSTNTKPSDGSLYYFVGIDKTRFKQPVMPGDQLKLEVEVARIIHAVWKFNAVAKVEGNVVASAELMCAERKLGS